MKRIALALATSAAALSLAAFTTFAAWTDTVTVTGNVITTGTVDLLVSTNHVDFVNNSAESPFEINNLVPAGALAGEYSFSLRNAGSVNLNLTGYITPPATISPTSGVDRTQLMIQVFDEDTDTAVSGLYSLAEWEASPRSITPIFNAGDPDRDYVVKAQLLLSALNEWQGQTVTFDLSVTGTQP